MTLAMFTDLITSTQVTALITNIAIVFGGLIAVTLVLSPAFLAKAGFKAITSKVMGLFGNAH